MTEPLAPEDRTWLSQIKWTQPRTVYSLTQHGARTVIPTVKGFYAFTDGPVIPEVGGKTLYLGIATGKTGIRGRLSSYLRSSVTAGKATSMKHNGKKLLSFTRINGFNNKEDLDLTDPLVLARSNTEENDKRMHVSWASAPLFFGGSAESKLETRRIAFMLERARIDRYRPIYNTADWGRWLDLELDEDAFGGEPLD